MSFNLKKLAVATAVLVSTVGLSVESAQARRARFSGDSDFKQQDPQVQVEALFDIVTDEPFNEAVENVSLRNSNTGEMFFTSALDSIEQQALLNTESELNSFLTSSGLDSFGITRDGVFENISEEEEEREPIAVYVVDLSNDLTPNDDATLTLFFDEELATFPQENGLLNLTNSPEGVVSYAGTETVPEVLIRNFRDGLDDPNDAINGRVIDQFGVGPNADMSAPFSVTVPEPTTANGLLIVGAFGGLLILKRNRGVKKS